jgi:hypothetical protein
LLLAIVCPKPTLAAKRPANKRKASLKLIWLRGERVSAAFPVRGKVVNIKERWVCLVSGESRELGTANMPFLHGRSAIGMLSEC